MDNFVVYFGCPVGTNSIFYIDHVCLVEKIMNDRRYKVEGSIQDEQRAPWLPYLSLVSSLIELLKHFVEDGGQDAAELGAILVLNVRVLHVNGAHCEQTIRQLVDQSLQNLVLGYARCLLVSHCSSGLLSFFLL